MPKDIDVIALMLQASLAVQIVMVILFIVSFVSWFYIFQKYFVLRFTRRSIHKFENEFWSGNNLGTLYEKFNRRPAQAGSLARIFLVGYREFYKGLDPNRTINHDLIVENARRAMHASAKRELDYLDLHLAFLATTGSVSPYIGLFGTVWGIMHAFSGLSDIGQATLASVAPGIAEALVATAIGLFAAIPAVVAYNRFSYNVDQLSMQFENFIEEFTNILYRQASA